MQDVAESTMGLPEAEQVGETFALEEESTRKRTLMIILAQVVAVAIFVVVWSMIRSRQADI
jgi:predicted nucleic acid-binding Zn ribbon protein